MTANPEPLPPRPCRRLKDSTQRAIHPSVTLHEGTGVSHNFISESRRENEIKPHRQGTFKVPEDHDFSAKAVDVVGRYPNPLEGAVVQSSGHCQHGRQGACRDLRPARSGPCRRAPHGQPRPRPVSRRRAGGPSGGASNAVPAAVRLTLWVVSSKGAVLRSRSSAHRAAEIRLSQVQPLCGASKVQFLDHGHDTSNC
jgi:hypothetical protein